MAIAVSLVWANLVMPRFRLKRRFPCPTSPKWNSPRSPKSRKVNRELLLWKDGLERELRDLVVESCHVTDAPEGVFPDAPMIGPDSLDAVEIVVAVQKKYDVRIGGRDSSREELRSLRVLADFIRKERT